MSQFNAHHLTAKQEAFCLAYIELGNASEAYRRAYKAERMKPETVNNMAHVLMKNREIAARLQELRAPAAEAAQVTLEQHLRDLKDIRDRALEAEKFGPAAAAEIARGKAAGLYIEKIADATNELAERLARARKRTG